MTRAVDLVAYGHGGCRVGGELGLVRSGRPGPEQVQMPGQPRTVPGVPGRVPLAVTEVRAMPSSASAFRR